MGCCTSSDEERNLAESYQTPAFTLLPELVSREKCAYSMMERSGWKSFFFDTDEFSVQSSTTPGSIQTAMSIKQSAFDMGADRMEIKSFQSGYVIGVVRRARAAMGDCFYIYTVREPYPGAVANKWNEEMDGKPLYCYGFLQSNWGQYQLSVYYACPEKGPHAHGKDPYKPVFAVKTPSWFFDPNLVVCEVDVDGKIIDDTVAVAMCSRDRWQWDNSNHYAVEVAPGVDAGLMVMLMAMVDEIREDDAAAAPDGG